jgi:hypothetical protein
VNSVANNIQANKYGAELNLAFARFWHDTGKNNFAVSPDLAYALSVTDPLKNQNIKFPFSTFVISLPDGIIPDVSQIWLTNSIPAKDQTSNIVSMITHNHKNDTTSYRCFNHVDFESPHDFALTHVDYIKDDTLQKRHNTCQRIAYNFIMWLTNNKHDCTLLKISKPLTPKQIKLFKTLPKEWVVGRNVKISRELKQVAEALIIGTGNPVTGISPQIRFMVRGHFRKQPCGPQRTLRKLLWIEPFMKGPEGAEAWAHIYQATDKTLTASSVSSTNEATT